MWDKINKKDIFFLLIDFQIKLFKALDPLQVKSVRKNIITLVKMFKDFEIPMLGTEQYRKGLGITDPKVTNEWAGEEYIEKMSFSCLDDESFCRILTEVERPVAILAGLETHICVLQTALGLIKRDYRVVVLSDACLSTTTAKWHNGLELMREAGACIMNTETLLFYLLGSAAAPEFKKLSRLIKSQA